MEYSAGLTSKLFWLQESRKTASYILEGLSKADIRKIAWEENIYQVKAEYRAYEVLNGTYRDLNVFFADKAMQSDVVAGWTDTAVRKLKQCFTRMMFEAGLLESSAKPRTIKPIHIDYRTEELLTAKGLGEYLKAVKGV